jgi:diguanylate cyclase (GGDEF)-like protein
LEDRLVQDTLTSKLRPIEENWDRLLHVKWNRDGFIEFVQAVQDAVKILHNIEGYKELAELLTRLEKQINGCLSAGRLPREAEREELQALLRSIRLCSPPLETVAESRTGRSARFAGGGEILALAVENFPELALELQSAGFRVRHLNTLTEMRTALSQGTPLAVIVDLDCQEGALFAGINMIAKDSERLDLKAPIFFLSERSDLMARLEAVSAGGEGYFTKPVDMPFFLEALNERLRRDWVQGRVLIVDDNPKEVREMALALEARGLVTETLGQPMEVLQILYRMQPDILLLDLGLREISGLDLIKAIRQHSVFENLPIIALSTQSDLNLRLAASSEGADDLLVKSLPAEGLYKAVIGGLRRSRGLRRQLARLNQTDTISGLYNRRYFLMQLQRLLARTENNTARPAVTLITLDNMRALAAQDVFASDTIVEQAADRLRSALGAGQRAAHFGDAIFAVLSNAEDREALLEGAGKIRTALESNPYRLNGEALWLRTSIGISIAENGKQEVQTLIQQADMACSSAWVGGGDHVQVFHPDTQPKVQPSQHKTLLEDIREAVQQQRMNLVFQPIVSMQGDSAERYEVLLRMYREGQALLPDTVFALTQRHRLGMVLDRWVIGQSIRLLKERQHRVHPTTLFVNISVAVLRDEEFTNWLKGGLEKTGVSAERLVLELAGATAEQHRDEVKGFLDKVKPLGCGFSLDRFTGSENSLQLLETLPVDYVKLDPQFARDLTEDKHKQHQLRDLAQQLSQSGVTTIAVNIEKLPTLFALWSCGINYVQGFFLQLPHEEMNYDFTSGAF